MGTDHLVEATCSSLIYGDDHILANIVCLIRNLAVHEQNNFLFSLLRILSKRSLSKLDGSIKEEKQPEYVRAIGGAAALILNIVRDSTTLKDTLTDWLIGVSGDGIGQGHAIHRTVIAVLSVDHSMFFVRTYYPVADILLGQVTSVLNKTLGIFGDKLSIKHTPMLHQEGFTSYFY